MSIRIGVVGVGRLGEIHVRLASNLDGAQLVGLYDPDAERAAAIAAKYGVQTFPSLDELLSAVDGVCIVTPTTNHFETGMAALRAGVHCFIEKPIASTVAEGEQLQRFAEENNLVLQVGHVERFNPAFLAMKGRSPEPMFVEAHRLAQFSPRATDVAVVLDLMIHDVDLVLALNHGQLPSEIRASGVAVASDEIDIANARLEFPNGCVANLTASRISRNTMRKMRLFARDSYISLDFAAPALEIFSITDVDPSATGVAAGLLGAIELGTRNRNIGYERPEVPPVNAIQEELRGFVGSIQTGTAPLVSAADGIAALRVAEDIIERIKK